MVRIMSARGRGEFLQGGGGGEDIFCKGARRISARGGGVRAFSARGRGEFLQGWWW